MLFPEAKSLDTPKCPHCGFQIQDSTCGCGLPSEPPRDLLYATPYVNHCWNCNTKIDSNVCKKSHIPGMGYCCISCGEDLLKWKAKMLGIPVDSYRLALTY